MDYFDEKSQQIDVDAMTAFGIELKTRHGKASQMAEMLLFAEALAGQGLHEYVANVFYDSKSDVCSFAFVGTQPRDRMSKMFDCAQRHIGQFEWEGSVYHGGAFAHLDASDPT